MTNSMNKFARGSEWRKWDLHVHSPASALNNHFDGPSLEEKWENYYKKLNDIKDISVIGITDYFSIEGYKKVIADNRVTNFDLILPNVELRILPVTSSEISINLHIIFDPKIVDQLESKFFSSLEFSYAGENYKCVRGDLVKLGRKFKDDPNLSDELAYRAGIEQFKTTHTALLKIFEKDKILRAHSIIFLSNSSKDGNSGIQHSSLASTREEIYRFAHCIFSGNPSDRLYFLGKGSDDEKEIIRKYASIKPCLHGSDAHSLDFICHPCAKRWLSSHNCGANPSDCEMRFCWIKADPTFEGLKQVIYEPSERVRVQCNNPDSEKAKMVLAKLQFEGSKNYIIPSISIPLSRELVTIIGGRGSGKSALLESIAFLNENHIKEDNNGKKKIIEYYRQNIDNKEPAPGFALSAEVIDKDGNLETCTKTLDNNDGLELPFLYIGQEQLSALATNDKELTEKICELINLDVSELDQIDLVDQGREILSEISNLHAEISELRKKYPECRERKFGNWLDKYVQQKEEQQKKLSSKTTKDLLTEISRSLNRGMKLKDYRSELEKLTSLLINLNINKQIEELNKTEEVLYEAKVKPLPLVNFNAQKSAIESKIKQLDLEMGSLRTDILKKKQQLAASGLKEDINTLLQATEVLQRELSNAIKDRSILRQKNDLLQKLINERNGLYNNIQQRLQDVKKVIDEKFIEFLESRDDSEKDEKELFKKIIDGIDIEGAIIFNQEVFCNYLLENCLDRRSIKTFEDLRAIIAKRNEKGQAKDVTLDSLKSWIETELDAFLESDQLTSRGTYNLLNYLFTRWSEFINIRTIVKLKEVPTEKLSVGQRGTLLLKIYLATASIRQILIIDQPEDNLDNKFIMNELVPLIRQIKKARQIILSTHNANLVVNADSEQVIIARLDNENDYISGSMEAILINKYIKEILEGGEEAFRSRENKYGMRPLHIH